MELTLWKWGGGLGRTQCPGLGPRRPCGFSANPFCSGTEKEAGSAQPRQWFLRGSGVSQGLGGCDGLDPSHSALSSPICTLPVPLGEKSPRMRAEIRLDASRKVQLKLFLFEGSWPGLFQPHPTGLGLQERISSFLFLLPLLHVLLVPLAGELMEPHFLSSLGPGPAWGCL